MTTEYSGPADPARSLALLWRTTERTSRKGRADLSVDRIVTVAIDIADTEGLSALSMRRVADRLGVGTMSLYTYIPGKAELIDVMLDAVYGETPRPESSAGGWREKLEKIARDNWALCRRHPWMLHAATGRPVLGPNLTTKYDYELRAIDGIGLTEVEMDSVLTLVIGHAQSAARGVADATATEKRSGMTDDQWWQAHAPILEQVMDPSRYPTAARVGSAAGAEYGAYDPEHAFEFGLARILDGIEVLVRQRG